MRAWQVFQPGRESEGYFAGGTSSGSGTGSASTSSSGDARAKVLLLVWTFISLGHQGLAIGLMFLGCDTSG